MKRRRVTGRVTGRVSWRAALLLITSLCVSLLIAEWATRSLFGDRILLYPRFHEEVVYGDYTIRRLNPDTTFRHRSVDGVWEFVVNSRGFRSRVEHEYEKPDGVTRIVCLGDSHTQGFECQQDRTYAAVMHRFFAERGISAEVINAGVSGFSTAEALVLLENEIIRYAPDAVVLGFFGNDPEDNVKADLFRIEDGVVVPHAYRHTPAAGILRTIHATPGLCWLSQNSYLYSFLFNRAWDWAKSRLLARKTVELTTEYAVMQSGGDADALEHMRSLSLALLDRMYAFCRRHGIVLVVLDIPYLERDIEPGWHSSVLYGLGDTAGASCDSVLLSTDLLAGCEGRSDIFVPHGQRHISEKTHGLLGEAAARCLGGRLGVLAVEEYDSLSEH